MTRSLAVLLLLAAGDVAAEEADAQEAGAKAVDVAVALETLARAAPPCDAARAHCFGIQLHVAVGAQGPVATPDWVTRQLATANRHFAAIDVAFQVMGADALPEEAARIEDAQERTRLGKLVAGTVIDVFVTARLDDIDKQDSEIYGVTWPTGTKKFVIVSTLAWERVLAHELGHVFGLPHSAYAISIMNKRDRKQPPLEQRTFHPNELGVMRGQLARLLHDQVIAHVPPIKIPVNGPISAPVKARP
jgi:hypothetical protein